MSVTQKETLPEVIRGLGWPNYSIAYPSDPNDYELRAIEAMPILAPSSKLVMFFYEGNDFTIPGKSILVDESDKWRVRYDKWKMEIYQKYLDWFDIGQVIFNMTRRLEQRYLFGVEDPVFVADVAGAKMGFLVSHTLYAVENDLVPMIDLSLTKVVWDRVACVFFIPTKFRVYAPLLKDNLARGITEPPPTLQVLNKALQKVGHAAYDLTPSLREAALRLASEGKFVYWPDDTHWNGEGIRAVAPAVANCLEQSFGAAKNDSPKGHL